VCANGSRKGKTADAAAQRRNLNGHDNIVTVVRRIAVALSTLRLAAVQTSVAATATAAAVAPVQQKQVALVR
jgi:hypothetical protein